jgi:hypothetical protein
VTRFKASSACNALVAGWLFCVGAIPSVEFELCEKSRKVLLETLLL